MKCSRCGSDDLIKGVRVVDRTEDSAKGTLEDEIVGGGTTLSAPVSATVCGQCGDIMFSVNPNDLADFRDAATVRKALKGNLRFHPRNAEFLKAYPIRKHLNQDDQLRHFARWIQREQEELQQQRERCKCRGPRSISTAQ